MVQDHTHHMEASFASLFQFVLLEDLFINSKLQIEIYIHMKKASYFAATDPKHSNTASTCFGRVVS